jgi:hypothetical protein
MNYESMLMLLTGLKQCAAQANHRHNIDYAPTPPPATPRQACAAALPCKKPIRFFPLPCCSSCCEAARCRPSFPCPLRFVAEIPAAAAYEPAAVPPLSTMSASRRPTHCSSYPFPPGFPIPFGHRCYLLSSAPSNSRLPPSVPFLSPLQTKPHDTCSSSATVWFMESPVMQSCGRRSWPLPPMWPYSRLGLMSSSRGKEAFGARMMQGLHETGVAAASVVPARCHRAPSFRQDRSRDWNCCPSRLVFGPSPARRRRIST